MAADTMMQYEPPSYWDELSSINLADGGDDMFPLNRRDPPFVPLGTFEGFEYALNSGSNGLWPDTEPDVTIGQHPHCVSITPCSSPDQKPSQVLPLGILMSRPNESNEFYQLTDFVLALDLHDRQTLYVALDHSWCSDDDREDDPWFIENSLDKYGSLIHLLYMVKTKIRSAEDAVKDHHLHPVTVWSSGDIEITGMHKDEVRRIVTTSTESAGRFWAKLNAHEPNPASIVPSWRGQIIG